MTIGGAEMTTFGIDLGTTYSCISYIGKSGEPVIVKNTIGEDSTPSVVFFQSPHSVVVGREAKDAAKSDADNVMTLVKRHMGRDDIDWEFHGVPYTPESVSAFILRDLVRAAEAGTGLSVRDVVITVPAYFGVAERQATLVAGELAGLNVLGVVPEPVAAALHYGALGEGSGIGTVPQPPLDETILVYDLGGGTFDTTVIRLKGSDITVVCTDGDHQLGGADWDEFVASHLQQAFVAEHPDSGAADSEEFMQSVALIAEETKQGLSVRQTKRQTLRYSGLKATVELSRATFEELTYALLDRTMEITKRTVEKASELGVHRIDKVLLVGGSTLMPAVARELRARFGYSPELHDPHLAVAKGAAKFAVHQSLKIGKEEPDDQGNITIVVPRAFGVRVVAEGTEPKENKYEIRHLLHANTPLPCPPIKEQFVTAEPDQQGIDIQIWEQAGAVESRNTADNKKIGECTISRLPPLPKGSPLDISFAMNETGVLRVWAKELVTGQTVNLDLQIGKLTRKKITAARDAIARLS